MGAGSYTGGHSKVFISDSGTTWEVSDRSAKELTDWRRVRWDPEIAVDVRGSISPGSIER
jgi:hypothetical protein